MSSMAYPTQLQPASPGSFDLLSGSYPHYLPDICLFSTNLTDGQGFIFIKKRSEVRPQREPDFQLSLMVTNLFCERKKKKSLYHLSMAIIRASKCQPDSRWEQRGPQQWWWSRVEANTPALRQVQEESCMMGPYL